MKYFIIIPSLLVVIGSIGISSAQEITGLAGWNIYLDPGHSQTENVGVYGYSEAEKNLAVALATRDLLLGTTDIDTVYISRTNSQEVVGLSQRSDHANSVGAAFFHSFHSNAGAPQTNNTLLLWGQLLSGAEKSPPGGQAMSDIMIDRLTRAMRIATIGSLGDCGFYGSFIPDACSGGGPYLSVNRRTTMASELSEAGYHTSPVQNTRNMNADWKRMEAKAFFWSILDYHSIPRPVDETVAGYIRDVESGELVNGATVTIGDSVYTTDTYESLFNMYSNDPEELRNGFYFIEGASGDPVTVQVSADGYEDYSVSVATVDTFLTFHDIELVPDFPPGIVSTSPAQDSTHQIIDPVVIDFDRKMDRPSVEAAFSLDPEIGGSFIWSENDFRLTFAPDTFFVPLTDYTLTISATAEGICGDGLDGDGDGLEGGDFVLAFPTGMPDIFAPEVVSTSPGSDEQGIQRDPVITMVFNEPIDQSNITDDMFVLESGAGDIIEGQAQYYEVVDKGVFTFFPDQLLKTETYYRLSIGPGLRDVFGNETTEAASVVFRVGELDNIYTSIDSFDGGLDGWWVPQQSGTTTGIVTDSTSRDSNAEVVNLQTGSSASMRLKYGWDSDASTWLIRIFLSSGAPANVFFDSTYTMQAYVFGDGSGNRFRFAVDDNIPVSAAGNHEVSPWFDIDWHGWRLVSWNPGRDGAGTWLGNGSLDGTLRFDSIQLSHVEGAAEFGTFYVDDLRLVKTAIATSIDSEVEPPRGITLEQNYPNPFRGSTTFEFDVDRQETLSLTIYNVIGSEVARVVEGKSYSPGKHTVEWNSDGIASGVYLARLTGREVERTIRILIVR